jgi:uncharacterized protein (TIGR04141 family)
VAQEKVKIQALSIFLIREGLTPAKYLKSGMQKGKVRGVGQLHFVQRPPTPPRWLNFLKDGLDEMPRVYNASNGALLTVRRGLRTFAISFGQGRHLLQPGSLEESFGLKVTLNSVDPERLKSVDRTIFDAISCQTRTQASQVGDITAFGMNIEQDLLRAATGYPIDKTLGIRMTGMDSLLVAVPTKLAGVPALLDSYLLKFEDEEYKKTFPWVDHISEVRDPKLRDLLDADLVNTIRTGDPSDMPAWLAVPDLVEWADIGGFRYRSTPHAIRYPDLHIRDFLTTVANPEHLSVATLKQRRAFAYGVDDEGWFKTWTLYACLYGELERDNTTYLLSTGKWYRVERDFVAAVNADIAPLIQPFALPDYTDKSEGDYNERVAKQSKGKLALMDRKMIRIGGSTVEFCDLYTAQRQMIHVKKYAGSSVLSHLFAQGSVAANAFLEDPAFRKLVNDKLPVSHRHADPSQRPDPRSFEVIYAVISRSLKPIEKFLPFFSRLNLRNAARQLRAFGYTVKVTKIQS